MHQRGHESHLFRLRDDGTDGDTELAGMIETR